MNKTDEYLSWLLAAEEHPYLKNNDEYRQAVAVLETSPALREKFADAKAFNQAHPDLFGFGTLPEDAKRRIARTLQSSAPPPRLPLSSKSPPPWSFRQQFAWAAVLALLLAGVSVMSSKIIEKQQTSPHARLAGPPRIDTGGRPQFYEFVSRSLNQPAGLQYHGEDTRQLVSWLEEQDGFAPALPDAIARARGNGCAVLEGPHGKISMLCVDMDGQTLRLFITCSRALQTPEHPARPLRIDNHDALEWSNGDNLFLLIQSQPEAPMPEIML